MDNSPTIASGKKLNFDPKIFKWISPPMEHKLYDLSLPAQLNSQRGWGWGGGGGEHRLKAQRPPRGAAAIPTISSERC